MELTTFAAILSVVVAAGEASRSLVIIPNDDSFSKAIGDSIVLTCKVVTSDGQRPPAGSSLRWLDDNDQEIVDVNGRRYVETDDTFKKLYIVNIVRSDAGNYKCVLNARVPLQKSVVLNIFQDITFERTPSNQYLRRHANGVIQCIVSGQPQPTVSWRFRGSRITTGGRYVVQEGGLQILNATDSDAGNYTCRAEVDEIGNYAERFISVAVNIPPVITQGPGRRNAVQGEAFFFQCEATGTPPPTFVFYKDGELLESDNRMEVFVATGVVRFRTVDKADEGSYTCTASNNVGNASEAGHVRVLVKAAVLEFPNVINTEGELAVLRCRAIGDPAPQMDIIKNGQRSPYPLGSSDGGRLNLQLVSRGILELHVNSLTADDASNYTCSAVNDVGQSQRSAVVTVNFGPQFPADHSREAYIWAGVSRNISCFPRAQPSATVEWMRFGQTIVNNDTYHIVNTANASYLQVYVREIDQAWIYGTYTCRARNDFGTKEININLQRASVPDAPKSVELTRSMPDGVVLTVEPPDEDGGMPVIGYRVYYGGNVQNDVTASGSTVVVKDLQPGTTYLLRITAKNEVGFGNYEQLRVTTKSLSNPYAVVITSPPLAESSTAYLVRWNMISSGGLPIIEYEFKYKRVRMNNSKFVPTDAEWTFVHESPPQPLDYFELHGLQPETSYQLIMRVRNQLGFSNYSSSDFVFHTPQAKAGAALDIGSPVILHHQLSVKILVTVVISLLFRCAADRV